MKRVLLFALVFGLGLAVLLGVARWRDARRDRSAPVVTPGGGGEAPVVPVPDGGGEGQEQITVGVEGRLDVTFFDPEDPEALPTYRVVAGDSRHLREDEHELDDIVLDLYDPETGAIRATMKADRGRVHMRPIAAEPRFLQDRPARLWDVELTLLSGAPFVPLTVYMPVVDVDLDAKSFTTDEPVRMVGSGMEAESEGLVVREPEGLIRLVREGAIDLWLEDETHVELDATGDGPIELLRRTPRDAAGGAETPEEFALEVSGGARLVVEGRESLRSDSDTLVVRGRRRTVDGTARFEPVDADAGGGAVILRGSDRFEGREAHLEFDPDGEPLSARLSGEPRARVWVDAPLEGDQPERRAQIDATGVGPLTVTLRPRTSFALAGPGRVEVESMGLSVDARESIAGDIDRDGNRGEVHLRGEVVARSERATWRGPELDLTFRRDERDRPVLDGHGPGPSHIDWLDDSGRLIEIDALGEADWVRAGDELLIPLAREARVRMGGEQGFVASAGLLQDFRRSTLSFEGSAGVELESERGRASAPRVIARGPDDVTFLGTTEERATFELDRDAATGIEGASLRALSVVRRGETATADGEVELDLVTADGLQELDCAWLELRSPALLLDAPQDVPHPFEVQARGVERADLRGPFGRGFVTGRELHVRGRFLPEEPEEPEDAAAPPPSDAPGERSAEGQDADDGLARQGRVELEEVVVEGDATVDFSGDANVSGFGDRFAWRPEGGGRLEAARGRRAEALVRLADGELPYRVSAEWIEFDERSVGARWPRLALDKSFEDPRQPGEDLLIGASAEWMEADEGGVFFSGLAHLVGRLADGTDWELDAGSVHAELERQPPAAPEEVGPQPEGALEEAAGALRSLVAWDGFDVRFGEGVVASGDVLEADFRVLRMEGTPARLEFSGLALESSHIQYDIERTLVKTDRGRATGAGGTEFAGWTIDYESLEPYETPDATILVVRNIRVRDDQGKELRAAWALFWVDRDRWQARTRDVIGPAEFAEGGRAPADALPEEPTEGAVDEDRVVPTIFGRLRTGSIAQVLTEAYVEGDVEFLRDGERYARMDAAYLDLIEGHGWLQNAEVYWDINVGSAPARLVARAEWMRHSDDGSLHADRATVTACDFHEPHLFVQTRDLRLTPIEGEPGVFRVALKSNSLRFDNGISMPLPPLSYKSDSQGRPYFGNLSFGDSARFGSFIEGTFNAGLGAAGGAVAKIAGSDTADVDGRIRYRASWLGSRGLLLGAGLEASVPEKFWMTLFGQAVNDDGEDRGTVRVPVEDRSSLRYNVYGRARYLLTEREWFDFAFSTQSDQGVQAEFSEGPFINYEQRDNFVHWRKAENEFYKAVTVAVRLDDFRNYVERLPEAIVYGGKTPIGEVNGLPLLYSSDSQAGYLRREVGTAPFSPFDPVYPDGLGDREVLRVDTLQRFEVPFTLREGSWRVSPFTSVQGTFWSEDAAQDGATLRGDVYAGAQASTHFVRSGPSGLGTTFTPTIGLRFDLANLEDGGPPVEIDEVELQPREGFLVDLGLRTQVWKAGSDNRLMLDLRTTHGTGVDNVSDGWLPLNVLAEFETRIRQVPVFFLHDGRYDLDDGLTVFSRSVTGIVPTPALGFEFGLHTGRDNSLERIYDAASAGARWRATEKWEFGVQQVWNLQGGSDLNTTFVLRRLGHDFVFDLELGQRAAEGTSLGFSIRPLLGFRPQAIGRIERWLDYDM